MGLQVIANPLHGDPRRQAKERRVGRVLGGAAYVSILLSALIVLSLVFEAFTFITEVDLGELFSSSGWIPRQGHFDLITIMVASLWVTGIALLLAVPVGMASAMYLSEYAKPGVRKVLKPILEILAGIPSVVLGYFALRFINPNIVQAIVPGANNAGNLVAAGIGVGILTIPLVASISEDALAAVPGALREASAGLGATKMTTTLRVVTPAALSGLVASFVIATSRAIGETMVVFIAGGAADSAPRALSPGDGSLTMTAAMASVASGTDNVAGVGPTFQSLFFVGLFLFLITLGLNMFATRLVRRYREVY
ncbi:MAG: phosphate ABC transporter permease subunit PstC [Acidimicrobiales bacterium]